MLWSSALRDRQHDHEMRFLRERTPLDRMHSRPGIEAAGVVLGVFGSIIHTNVLSFNGKPQTQVKQAGLACACGSPFNDLCQHNTDQVQIPCLKSMR